MLKSFRARKSNVLVWVLMVMLIVGLGGFGIGVSGGLSSDAVARVGDQAISTQAYARAIDQQIRSVSDQAGRPISIDEARQFGLDRVALARLVNNTALDTEAQRLGVSSGDEAVREQLLAVPAFQRDGAFDREAYTLALDRVGLSPAEFEAELRNETSRGLLATGLTAGVVMPDTAAQTVLGFIGERRGFEWFRLDETNLVAPVPAPDAATLAAFHEEHAERYTRPETRRIAYAIATPETVAEGIEIPEDELRAAYDADPGAFGSPERRILERIGFGTETEAAEARSRIDDGEATFDAIAEARGLSPDDLDEGTVTADTLSPEAREVVFGAGGPGVVGPVDTPLGPSLYRINAILDAQTVPFEEARDALAQQRATEAAERMILDDLGAIEDLIAGGAKLEEIASETVMQLGEIELNDDSTEPLAADPAFRTAADAAVEGEETDLVELEGGGYATLRLEAVVPPALIPLDEIRDTVTADWHAAQVAAALAEQAQGYATEIEQGLAIADLAGRLGIALETAAPMTRGEVLPGTPPRLVSDVFAADEGDVITVEDGAAVILAELTVIGPYDPDDPAMAGIRDTLRQQYTRQAADDALALFTTAVRDRAGVRINQSQIDATLGRFQ